MKNKKKKSYIVAGLLGFFFGTFGIHEFYLGRKVQGALYIILTIIIVSLDDYFNLDENLIAALILFTFIHSFIYLILGIIIIITAAPGEIAEVTKKNIVSTDKEKLIINNNTLGRYFQDITKSERIKNASNVRATITKGNQEYERNKKRLLARARLEFMDFNDCWDLNGFEFEDYFSEQLSGLGIKNKALPKSGDYGADTLVYGDVDYAVQLKHYTKSTVGISAVQEIFAGAMHYGDITPVILTTGTYTKAAVTLARSTNVELINKGDIEEWHNDKYTRGHSHIRDGLYKYIQDNIKIEKDENIKKRKITIIVDNKGINILRVNVYRSDYEQIAEVLFPEFDISVEIVDNHENLDIFPLIRGKVKRSIVDEVIPILKHPVLSGLYKEKKY